MQIISERLVAPVLIAGVPADDASVPPSRTPFERLLWGSATEYCDDCGKPLRAREAIRYPGGRVYCSVDHATASEND